MLDKGAYMPEQFSPGDLVTKKSAKRKVIYKVWAIQSKGKGHIYDCRMDKPGAHVSHMIPGAKLIRHKAE